MSVYFDNAATTPLDPRVADAMHPYMTAVHGNASSLHSAGRRAREAVDLARREVADLIGATPAEIVFTSSGTEADNLAIAGAVAAIGVAGCHVVTSAVEHPAVRETCRALERRGAEVTLLPVDADGAVHPESLAAALRPDTRLVSVMAANNIVGTIQPIDDLGRMARAHGALFHTDAVQAVGRLPLDVRSQPIDLLSISAHKFHGPKGVGALYVRKGTSLAPIVHGGGQENGLRSGTENVAGIVGAGRAAAIAAAEMPAEIARLERLRDRILAGVVAAAPGAYVVGHPTRRLPGHACFGFAGLEGEAIRLLLALDEAGVAVASGSACSSHHAGEPSHVLLAMGFDPVRARGSLRVTLGRFNTDAEVDRLLEVLPRVVAGLRPATSRATSAASRRNGGAS